MKGSIKKGKQADILVFDPEVERTICDDDILSRTAKINIFRKVELRGKVIATFLRGQKIYDGLTKNHEWKSLG